MSEGETLWIIVIVHAIFALIMIGFTKIGKFVRHSTNLD